MADPLSTSPTSGPTVRVIERPPTRVAYLRHTGAYGDAVSRFWTGTVVPWMVGERLMRRALFGISHDDPGLTVPSKCRYDACIEIDAAYQPAQPARGTTIPGGHYAAMSFSGTTAQVADAWAWLRLDWLRTSRLQQDLCPCFEHYPIDTRFDPATGAFSCELCVPVALV
jgi:AraC family transcriptional regulator